MSSTGNNDNYSDIENTTTDASMQVGADGEPQKSDVRRELDDVPEDRLALCKTITRDVKAARKFWDADFKRMRKDMDFLLGLQYAGQTSIDDDDRYTANIVQRHVQQRTAAIYAKNPTVVARRKQMLDFQIWDENPLTFQMATQLVSQAGQVQGAAQAGDPQAQLKAQQAMQTPQFVQEFQVASALLKDVQQGMMRRAAADRISKTIELYFKNKVLAQQSPPFKSSMKQLVRRTMAAGIGYIKLGLVRDMEMSPDVLKGMATIQEQMATIDMMMADIIDNDPALDELSGQKEELRLALKGLQERPMVVTQEGLLFDFPTSTSIIPDPKLIHLQGFVGCDWVAEEYLLTPEQVEMVWKVDVKKGCSVYDPENSALVEASASVAVGRGQDGRLGKKGMCCVWIVYNRTTGLTYTVCDGYKDFLEDPCPPKLHLERFFPWFVIGFNYIEHQKQRFPLSDVHLLRHPQREYNRAREGLRQHRIANRPLTAVAKGQLDEADITKLETRPDNAVVQLNALAPGQNIDNVLQRVKHPPIDEAVYETDHVFQDVLRVVGSQEANLGGTSNSTATESSIAESSRMSSLQSNMDDMDDFLTELMRAAGQAALCEIGADEVTKVVGPGAAWPTLSAQDIADEIFLEIMAGSSGRPNRSLEVQNITQAMPYLLQLPGMNPEWVAKQLLSRLDDRLDLTDAFLAGQPSIQTLNALAAKPLGAAPQGAASPGGEGTEDPAAQGGNGGNNAAGPAGGGGAVAPRPAPAAAPMAAAPVPVGAH